jgi:hypothetical protein
MKRIKIMLVSLVVLATAGGVLAFKVKADNFCLYKKVSTTCPKQTTKPEIVALTPGGMWSFLPDDGNCPAKLDPAKCTFLIVWEEN